MQDQIKDNKTVGARRNAGLLVDLKDTSECGKTALKDFAIYARQGSKHFILYSLYLEFVAWLAFLDFLVNIYWFFQLMATNLEAWLDSFSSLFGKFVFLLFLFILLRRSSKRYRINSKKMLLTESRQPIIYLRAFSEEFEPDVIYYDKAKTDETLAQVLKNTGPLVAVGRPGDKLPPLGAIRVYFNNEVWKDNVDNLMTISKFVIIQAGHCSPGLAWEMATAVKRLKPEQLLFTFLSWQELDRAEKQSKYQDFASQFKVITNLTLPERIDDAYFLRFNHNWKPKLVSLSGWKRYFFSLITFLNRLFEGLAGIPQGTFHNFKRFIQVYGVFRKTSVSSVRETLRPVLKMQGIALPVWETTLYFCCVLGAIIFVLAFFILSQI